jgi:uncharacterized protein YndB with AHSA1/START domain
MSATTQAAHQTKIATPSDRVFTTERIFDAPRATVWRAYSEPELLAQWWGRGNKLVIEKFELERGGHWRFVEHINGEVHGFEGRFREVTPIERIVRSFEWDGMPAHVIIETLELQDLGDGRTRVLTTSQFHTQEERDGMMAAGMEGGLNESYAALDRLLATMG